MTNYNGRLDEQLNYLMEYSYKYGRCEIPSSENPPLIIARQAKQAITSLMKELVAEAKEQLPTSEQLTTKSGYHVPGKMYGYKLGLHDAREAIDQFEQNLLKALEEL